MAHAEGRDEFAAGLAYEYRLDSLFGVGGFVEHAGQAEDVWTFGVPLFVHPYQGVRLLLAPGLEQKDVQEEGRSASAEASAVAGAAMADETADKGAQKTEQSWLLRAGVAYEVELGRWSLTPEFNIDFVEGGHQTLVYGISLGCGF